MDWASIWKDIVAGLLIAGALAAWVPESFWQSFFLVDHPLLSKIWGPLVGPIVAMLSLCVLDRERAAGGGAVERRDQLRRRGGVHLRRPDRVPILNIYRKYYGRRMSLFLLATFYVSMVLAGIAVEVLFQALGLVPDERTRRSSRRA